MKDLIDNIVAFLQSAIDGGDIKATKIYKGFSSMPEQVPYEAFPYIAIDEGGERVEDIAAATQNRKYEVLIEFGILVMDPERSLDEILTLSDSIKTELEKETNRQLDGHIWGISIRPYIGQMQDDKTLFRARQVTVEFQKLEDREGDY